MMEKIECFTVGMKKKNFCKATWLTSLLSELWKSWAKPLKNAPTGVIDGVSEILLKKSGRTEDQNCSEAM